ncbi:PAS domain-containing protein [Rhodococcus opacus]|uniref:PAS domain-containing protein n=1 Tax=Rhodococcus opacus TaxID=37919 RepID=A0AAX3YQX3_RHOOP|nr:PAS domain-containing protein [Rhodococcus opacus]NHU49551.1 PAS domain-containing protein [Rhodococcus sp. A14]MCZ4588569.1 PAS domain-containing protein [Rhodococcus opacus]MDV6247300.1 PAS domain-containing protein [Rhodococcus opacus]WKN59002.1 PAS domain-containing protein [Rhodococcus opacus]WLF50498.1 PAS domain-containing protein [Rhodococcus opacus]
MPLGARPYNRTGFPRRTPALVLLARLPVPVLPLHRDGHVVHVNWAFEDMLGYPHDALSGRSIHDPVPTVSPPVAGCGGSAALGGQGRDPHAPWRFYRAGGDQQVRAGMGGRPGSDRPAL